MTNIVAPVATVAPVVVNSNLVEKSVSDFKLFAKQTALGILEMGRIVYEAKKNLTQGHDFEIFCERVGYTPSASSIKKLNQIGKSYTLMLEHADSLPNNWTTLYEISRLSKDQLNQYIEEGVIHQNALGATIKALTASKKDEVKETISTDELKELVPNGTNSGLQFTCVLKDVVDAVFIAQLQMILKSLSQLDVRIDITPELKMALQPALKKAA